jgi:hypothetical protein
MFGLSKIQQPHRLPSRLTMLLLCAALLFVQSLGHVHRAMHWPAQGALSTLAIDRADGSGQNSLDLASAHADQGFLNLFKDHQDLPKCQLFDGVGSASALVGDMATVPVSAQSLILSSFYNIFVVERLSRHFQARAPPYA